MPADGWKEISPPWPVFCVTKKMPFGTRPWRDAVVEALKTTTPMMRAQPTIYNS